MVYEALVLTVKRKERAFQTRVVEWVTRDKLYVSGIRGHEHCSPRRWC